MFTKSLRGKTVKAISIAISAALVLVILTAALGSALAAPTSVGPRSSVGGADPANGIYVSTTGNDNTANGTINAPYRSINRALASARSGDTIILRGGTYREGQNVRVRVPNITIKSRAGEWAVIDLTNMPSGSEDSGVYFDVESSGGRLQGVEVIGGFYAVCLETRFEWGQADRSGASNIIIEDCKLHDSRNDVVKVKPNCDNVTIRYNEIYNSGRAFGGGNPNGEDNSEGIDNVNGDNMLVQNNYIHNICSNAIYAKGGATNAIIEDNRIENAYGAGILVGFDTSPQYFDTAANPQYYENIGGIVRYNLIVHTGWEGIGFYGSRNAQVYNNTLVDVNYAQNYHSAIYFGLTYQDWEARAGRPATVNPNFHHNIVSQPATFTRRQMLEIRYSNDLGGMSALSGNPTMSSNCYYIAGRAAGFTDNRPGRTLSNGTLSAWQAHIGGDSGSIEVNPGLDANYVPTNPQCAGMGCFAMGTTTPPTTPPTPTLPTPTLTLAVSPAGSQTYPGNVTLTATMTGAANGNSGKAVSFTVNGAAYSATTNASGVATYAVTSPTPGTYSFGASFAGDAGNNAASAAGITGYVVNKAAGSAVSRPTASGITATGFTAASTLTTSTGQSIEYAVGTSSTAHGAWQASAAFTGLAASTNYYIFARSAENARYNAGAAAVSDAVRTLAGSTTPPTNPGQTTYNIADFYSTSGRLSVKNGDIIIVGTRQYRVLANTYTIEYWSQNTLTSAISWWTSYMNSFVSGGVVAEITGTTPPTPPTPPTLATPTLTLAASPAGAQTSPGNVTLTATLAGAANGNSGKAISFTVNGAAYSATTNASGVATYTVSSPLPGTYSFGASFAGDAANNPASAAGITGYAVNKAAGSAVSRPTASGITTTGFTAAATLSTSTGQSIEYSIGTNSATHGAWQTSAAFTGLASGTTYYIFARSAENARYNAGAVAVSNAVATLTPVTPPTTPGQTTYNIADFYSTSGRLSVKSGDIIIVGTRQYRVLASTYTIEYWSQNNLTSAISWWTSYMNSFASGGVVVAI